MVLQLFRGENIANSTKPGLYRGDGLRSKAFGAGGDPAYINKAGLLETIRMHVNPSNAKDFSIYGLTEYLSFSESMDNAYHWAMGPTADVLDKCIVAYGETRYVFCIAVERSDLIEITDGVFEYRFRCNPMLKAANSPDPILTAILQNTGCPVCDGTRNTHSIIFVDTVCFLERHKHLAMYEGAYNNAIRDNEWLLLPNDPLGQFKEARIPRADFWSAIHYIAMKDGSRDPETFAMMGTIIA
jgi:hypothetical protein